MADLIFLVLAVGFFGLCGAYVRGLDRLVREVEQGEVAAEVTR